MEKNLLGMPPIKREGQEMSRRCDMQCDGVRMEKEIERLQEEVKHLDGIIIKWSVLQMETRQEADRFRQQNAELVEALKWIVTEDEKSDPFRTACAIDHAREVIAKPTGDE